MKKLITVWLSLALMLALAVPAAAYEGAEDDTDNTEDTADNTEWTLDDWDGVVRFPDNLDPGFAVDDEGNRLWDTHGDDEIDEAQWQERLDSAITEAGGIPGQVNVMLNGKCVTFPYGVPEITSGGRTMVPMRAILEALGAEVDYDNDTKTAQAVLGDLTITHVVGSDIIDSSKDGQLTMDTVSYVKDGSTLVPLRFFSQALGYEVYWDNVYRTAVVIDKAKLVREIDSSLTIVNDLLAQENDVTGNQSLSLSLDATVQLAGSDEMPLTLEMTALYNETATNINCTADISVLPALLEALGEEMPKELALLPDSLEIQCIFSDGIWMTIPSLKELTGDMWFEIADDELMDEIGQTFELYDAGMAAKMTMGGLLYTVMEYADTETPFNLYSDLTEVAGLVTEMLGDDTFTEDGGAYTWNGTLPEALWTTGGSPVSIQMTIGEDGTCTYTMELDYEDMVKASIKGTSSATEESMEGEIHIQDVCDATFQMTATLQASEDAPVSEPPAGAQIIPLPLN